MEEFTSFSLLFPDNFTAQRSFIYFPPQWQKLAVPSSQVHHHHHHAFSPPRSHPQPRSVGAAAAISVTLGFSPLSSPLSACSEAGARTEPSERPLSGDPHGASRRFQQIRELQRALLISQTCNQYDAALFITAVKNMQEVPSGPNRYRV